MIPRVVSSVYRSRSLLEISKKMMEVRRNKIYFKSGAIKPMPVITPFGLFGVTLAVIPGLLVGAFISKNIASFLEENDLFSPQDDDDDD